jgi:hypothetical protein
MRVELRTFVIAGVLLAGFASSAGAAESAVVDLAPRSGPSRFVSGVDGKPAQIGLAAPERSGDEPGVVIVVPAPQIEPESQSDKTSSDGTADEDTVVSGKEGGQQKADVDPDKSAGQDSDDEEDTDQANDTEKAPEAE